MPPKARKAAATGRLVGYARVSTEEQALIAERTKAGLRACDPAIIRKIQACRDATWQHLLAKAERLRFE
jgi:hypothetical protein